MAGMLDGKSVAILMDNEGVEEVELTEPMSALKAAGARVTLVAPKQGEIQAFNHHDRGGTYVADRSVRDCSADDFDALMLPGGVINADRLRMDGDAVRFVRAFFEAGKPVAAICHAPWTLIEAEVVRGRTLTSYPSLQTDLRNAGAEWMDEEVITDHGLVTSRRPGDLPAFCSKMIEEFAEGIHEKQKPARFWREREPERTETT
jgi:protease I